MASNYRNRIVGHGTVAPDQLLANPANWRTHPKAQQAALEGALSEIGWVQSVVVNQTTGRMIDGHLRVSLALRHSEPEIPVIYVELSEAEEALALATFDPIGALAGADRDQLDALLREVSTGDAALQEMLGDLAEEHGIVDFGAGTDGLTDPDAVPDPPADPVSNPGDVWLMGQHRLLCGDGRRMLDSSGWGTLVVDPPWDEIQPDAGWRNVAASVIAFGDGQRGSDAMAAFGPPTWTFVWDCVSSWYVPNRPLRRAKLAFWYGEIASYREDGAFYGESDRNPRTVSNTRGTYLHVPDARGKHLSDVFSMPITKFHATSEHRHAKPVDWIRLLLGNCGGEGRVADPFAGSGTTLIACEQLGIGCDAAEIDPAMCDVIVRRWEVFSGRQAELQRTAQAAD